jgi:alcohol dehydrogenase, propanol-preferring
VDVKKEQLYLAKQLGAEVVVNAAEEDAVQRIQQDIGGAHGVLVTAVSRPAFAQAVGMTRRRGTISLVGLPPGTFDLDIFDLVLSRKTVRGSIVGTRNDLTESLEIAALGKARPHFSVEPLDNINSIFDRMRENSIDGRIVMKI